MKTIKILEIIRDASGLQIHTSLIHQNKCNATDTDTRLNLCLPQKPHKHNANGANKVLWSEEHRTMA